MRNAYTDPKVCILVELRQTKGGTSSGGSRKKYLGGGLAPHHLGGNNG